jgi:hypothetical protein
MSFSPAIEICISHILDKSSLTSENIAILEIKSDKKLFTDSLIICLE